MQKLAELVRWCGSWIMQHKAIAVVVIVVCVAVFPAHYASAGLFTEYLNNPIDATALILAGIIQMITGFLGKIVLFLIQLIVIPILGYDGFYNSNITNLGWSLVRDVVNMFVVVVLLAIAILTMIGHASANWTQQLPKLFLTIVLVNFSKLLCGIAIDISQVIMFTFVNAIVSIAAGNFSAMLGLSNFGQFSVSFIERINEAGDGIQAFMFLGGAYMQFITYMAILAVMFLLAIALVWSIVILWVSIIMAPLAIFAWGIKDLFHSAGDMFSKWMKGFTSALIFRNIMVFFLWLALAASAGSSLAQTEEFPMPEDTNAVNFELESYTLDNFLGMFLALAILIAGMQQAAGAAGAMGGFAASVLNDKNGIGLAKGLARPFKSAKDLSRGMVKGGKFANTFDFPGLAKLAPGATDAMGRGLARTGTALQKRGLTATGAAIGGMGGFAIAKATEVKKEKNKEAAEELKYLQETDGQKEMMYSAMADSAAGRSSVKIPGKKDPVTSGLNAFDNLDEEQRNALRTKFLTDTKTRKKIKEALQARYKGDPDAERKVKDDYEALLSDNLKFADSDEGKKQLQLDDAQKDLIEDMKTENLHLIKPKDGETKQEAIAKHLDARKAEGKLRIGAVSDAALGDPDVIAVLKKTEARQDKDGRSVSHYEEMSAGRTTLAQANKIAAIEGRKSAIKMEATDIPGKPENVRTLVNSGMLDDMPRGDARMVAVMTELPGMVRTNQLAPKIHGAASSSLLDKGYTAQEVFGPSFPADAASVDAAVAADPQLMARMGGMVTADLSNARHLNNVVPSAADVSNPANANEVTDYIASSVDKDRIKKMQMAMMEETDPTKQARHAQGLDVIGRAVTVERVRARADGEDKRADQLEQLETQISTAGRYSGRRARGAATAATAAGLGAAVGTVAATAATSGSSSAGSGPAPTPPSGPGPAPSGPAPTPGGTPGGSPKGPKGSGGGGGGTGGSGGSGGSGSGGGTGSGPAPAPAPAPGPASGPTPGPTPGGTSAPTPTPGSSPAPAPASGGSGSAAPVPAPAATSVSAPVSISTPAPGASPSTGSAGTSTKSKRGSAASKSPSAPGSSPAAPSPDPASAPVTARYASPTPTPAPTAKTTKGSGSAPVATSASRGTSSGYRVPKVFFNKAVSQELRLQDLKKKIEDSRTKLEQASASDSDSPATRAMQEQVRLLEEAREQISQEE